MEPLVRGGAHPRRHDRIAVELRALELKDRVAELTLALVRLRSASVDYLTSLEADRGQACARLRHELERSRRLAP